MTPRKKSEARPRETPDQIEAVVAQLDPGYKRQGRELLLLNPHRKDRDRGSFKINMDSGAWRDFADTTGKASGNGADSLKRFIEGTTRLDAVTERAVVHKVATKAPGVPPRSMTAALPAAPKGTPGPTPKPPAGFKHGGSWPYRNAVGLIDMWTVRYDQLGGGKKICIPHHWNGKWIARNPMGFRPLYNRDQLAKRPNDPVLVNEGEKSADAASTAFPEYVSTTSPGGASSAAEADWGQMKGRDVWIWPDHDSPGIGYAQDVARLAYAAGATSVRMVEIPDDFEEGWDLADEPPKGVNLKDLLAAAVVVPRPLKPIEMLDPSSWLTSDPPPIRWLLKGLLPHGLPAILAGKSNCGKSLAAMEISIAVAAGMQVFGLGTDGIARKILFVSMEDDADELHRRFRRCLDLFREWMIWTPEIELRLLANWRAVVPVWASKELKTLGELTGHLQDFSGHLCAEGEQLGLIVLDTFAALTEGEENAAEVQQAFWAACHLLVETTGATPLVVHHVRKTPLARPPSMQERLSFENLRGSSAIVAGARAILQMEPLTPTEATRFGLDDDRAMAGNYVVLALTKLNGGPKGAWMALEQRSSEDVGAGFFDMFESSDQICAGLRSKAAAASLNQAEGILLALDDKVAPDDIAKKYWPDAQDRVRKLNQAISSLRTKKKWLEKGSVKLTSTGKMKVFQLRQLGDSATDTTGAGGAQ